jgi:hypothetical protein
MLLETIVAAVVPAGIEGLKQLITRFTGGVKPTTIAEQIQLEDSYTKRLEAIADMDKPIGTPSQWVIDLRASSRYIMAGVVILFGVSTLYIPVSVEVQLTGLEAANIAFGFLFGQRIADNFVPTKNKK